MTGSHRANWGRGYQSETIKYWQGRDGTYHDMKGENARSAKLTEAQVRSILLAPSEGSARVSNRALARQYGVSEHAIIRIRKRITWTHIEVPVTGYTNEEKS